jgi:isopenicillin-N N-acyltransferase-like protein
MELFPFVELTGTPYEIGRGHGERLRDSIHLQLSEALEAASRHAALSRAQALEWAERQLPKLERIGGADWIAELQGLADGARMSLAEAAALQVRPGTGGMPEACTSLGVACDASATGEALGGQNRDLVPKYRGRMALLLLRPQAKPALLMHSVPGEIGGVGMNSQGVAVFANSIWARSGRNWQAAPVTRRAILECPSAEEAAARVRAMDGPAVGSFLVIDRSGRILNLEILPQGLGVISRDRGVFVRTNHCLDASVLPHEAERTPAPGSPGRCARARDLLEPAAGRIGVETLKAVLSDHAGRPEPICRHAADASAWETASCLIGDLGARTLHLSYGPPCEGRFATYRLG